MFRAQQQNAPSGHKSSSRKLSAVSRDQMQRAHASLSNLFDAACAADAKAGGGSSGIRLSASGLVLMVRRGGFIQEEEGKGAGKGKGVSEAGVKLIYERVKVGKKAGLTVERVKEAWRQVIIMFSALREGALHTSTCAARSS